MNKEIATLQNTIDSLKKENANLLAKIKQNEANAKDILNKTNNSLTGTTKELEQYKNHLEEVIRERTLDLKTSEQRLLSVSDSLLGGAIFELVLTKDDTPWVNYSSPSLPDLIGVKTNEIQNNFAAFEKTIHPDDLIRFREIFMRSKLTKSEFDIEVRFSIPNTPIKWLHIRANATEVTDENTTWVGIILDTTEKNKTQQQIQEREAILNAIIENIPYDFWAIGSDNICFLQNSASRKLWGDILGKEIEHTNIPQNTVDFFKKQIESVKAGNIVNEETRLIDTYNNSGIYQTLLAPILLGEEVRGILCFNIDISDRKQGETERLQNEKKFRNIFDNSTDAIIIHTHSGHIIEMNHEFENLIGYNENNKSQIKLCQLLEKDIESDFFKKIKDIENTADSFFFETNFNTLHDQVIPIEIKSKEIEYLDSKAILSLIRNNTYRKRFERQLVNTIIETEEKERARLAADLHDDIGPILSSMKMLTGLLIDTKDSEKAKKISKQLLELVTESIRSVRETSNSISPHILKNYGIIAATKNIIQSTQHLIPIHIDTNCENKRFESTIEIIYYRVLRELLNNTIKHAQANNININLHYENKILSFTYKDDGIGFNVAEKTKESTSGMGLYNIISRIKSLEANYKFKSKKGEGTYFILETNTKNKQYNNGKN